MSAFLTIVKLTFRNGMRSHLFQLLLLVLLLCVVAIPATISGDGTADGFIRVSLLYSLAAVSTVLALSSVWLGCFVMSQDIENYQLHMVVTKPVSRAKIWLAKWVGVNLINLLLLVVSSLAIYGLILYNFNRQEFSQEERQKMANEVMVGRRVFLPDRPDFSEESRKLVARKISDRQKQGIEVDTSQEDVMRIRGGRIRQARVQSHGDHRMAMSMAVAGLLCDGEMTIEGAECVAKSYPGFFEDLEKIRI